LIRAVFDTVTLLQGVSSPDGPAGACFRLVLQDKVILMMSIDGLFELHDVAQRQETRTRFPKLAGEVIEGFLDSVRAAAWIVLNPAPLFRYPRDPGDEHILNVTIAAKAAFLVTRDKDLLDLMSESNPDGAAFRQLCPTARIVDPVTFLEAIPTSPTPS
jgi:putative PIN family toxin of toxin-antitoxin system